MATLNNLIVSDTGSVNLPRGTTVQRPSSPQLGYMRFNTDISDIEFYDGTNWICIDKKCKATVTGSVDTKIHGGYKIHTFTGDGNFNVVCAGEIEYLIVAGGGAGGRHHGGGGGGGGLLQGTQLATPQTYGIVVGVSGTPTPGTNSAPGGSGGNGGNSSALGLTAIGGGGGANAYSNGASGGSGGGSHNWTPAGSGGAGTAGQGSDGADTVTNVQNDGGGGGGAGGTGYWQRLESYGRDGGPGLASSISGQLRYYAGGGGAGMYQPGFNNQGPVGQGGSGVGGSGATGPHGGGEPGQPGVANTGGGGGGTAAYDRLGGTGGSGVVIIRYLVQNKVIRWQL